MAATEKAARACADAGVAHDALCDLEQVKQIVNGLGPGGNLCVGRMVVVAGRCCCMAVLLRGGAAAWLGAACSVGGSERGAAAGRGCCGAERGVQRPQT